MTQYWFINGNTPYEYQKDTNQPLGHDLHFKKNPHNTLFSSAHRVVTELYYILTIK